MALLAVNSAYLYKKNCNYQYILLSLLLFRCRYLRSAGIFCRTICPTSYEHLQHRLLKFWPQLFKRWIALSSGLVLGKVIVLSTG